MVDDQGRNYMMWFSMYVKNIFLDKCIIKEERVKNIKDLRFVHFAQISKMSTIVVCDKIYIYNVLPKAITEKSIQRDLFKNSIDISKWDSKKCS